MFHSIFLSVFFLLAYPFVFYLFSDTPLKFSSFLGKLDLLGLIFFMSALGAGAMSIIFSVLQRSGLLKAKAIETALRLFVFVLLFFAFLLLAENWSYSVFGFGLKTTIAWWSKLLFAVVAIFLSSQFSPMLVRLGQALDTKKIWVGSVVGLAGAAYLVTTLTRVASNTGLEEEYGEIKDRLNVIILLSDGVDASQMSVYGSEFDTTPFLNSIRSEFMVFDNAYTNNQNSTGSVTAMLTGLSPFTSRVVYPPDLLTGENSKQSLPRILGRYGYYRSLWGVPHYVDADSQNLVGAFDSNNTREAEVDLVRSNQEKNLAQRVVDKIDLPSLQMWYLRNTLKGYSGVTLDATFVEELDNPFLQVAETEPFLAKPVRHVHLSDENRILNLLQDIDDTSRTGVPLFSLTHLMKTHGSKFRPKNQVFSRGQVEEKTWMIDFYRDAILEFDVKASRVYQRLKATDQLNNTLLIITSDHGMSWSNRKRVPLLIRWPNTKLAGSHNVNVQLLDIAPTVLDALGLETPVWMEGKSLVQPETIKPDRFIFSAGVFGNRLSGDVWLRKDGSAAKFYSSNCFSN